MLQLVGRGRGADADELADALLEFLKAQGAVVKRAGQAEAVGDQRLLARAVAVIHRANLRQGDMAFIDEDDVILREVIQQGIRRVAGLSAVEIAGIVFDARAVAQLAEHLDIVLRALGDALRLDQIALFLEFPDADVEVVLDVADGAVDGLARGGVMRRGVDGNMFEHHQGVAADHIDGADAVDLVSEEFHAERALVVSGGEDFHHVAAHAERAALKFDVAAVVLDIDELADQLVARHRHARTQGDHHPLVFGRVAHRIDARHRGDDDHIPPLAQRRRRAVAQALDLLVDGGILFDIGIGGGDVRLRLVIIVVGDEVLDRAVRKELAKLGAELRGQRLVVRDDQRWALHALDDGGHRIGFARTGDAQQHLTGHAALNALRQRLDGLRLVALRLERRFENKAPFLHDDLLILHRVGLPYDLIYYSIDKNGEQVFFSWKIPGSLRAAFRERKMRPG